MGLEPDGPRPDRDKPALKFGNCEDSWDCEGTQRCCSLGPLRWCCSDGTTERWVPVPIPVRPNDGYPGPYGGGNNGNGSGGGYYR